MHVIPSSIEYFIGIVPNKLKCGLPIIIGVIPLRNITRVRIRAHRADGKYNHIEYVSKSLTENTEPSAPGILPNGACEVPPPTYEEATCIGGNKSFGVLRSIMQFRRATYTRDDCRPLYPMSLSNS